MSSKEGYQYSLRCSRKYPYSISLLYVRLGPRDRSYWGVEFTILSKEHYNKQNAKSQNKLSQHAVTLFKKRLNNSVVREVAEKISVLKDRLK